MQVQNKKPKNGCLTVDGNNSNVEMDRFEYADSRLGSGEAVLLRHKGVKLYDGDTKVRNQWH